MPEPTRFDRWTQRAAAVLLLAPLLLAFFGAGGFDDAYGAGLASNSDTPVNRNWILLEATGRSIGLAAVATLVALLIGVPAAWALAQRSQSRQRVWALFLLMVCVLPLALPASVSVSGWISLVGPEGAASRFKVPIPGFGPESRGLLFSIWGAGLVLGCSLWPVVALEAWPGFRRARNESYDAALLASSRWDAFWNVLVPQIRGELAAGGTLVFLLVLSDFAVSSLLLVRTLPIEVHDSLMVGKTASAAAAALPLLVTILFIASSLSRLTSHEHVSLPSKSNDSTTGRGSLWVLAAGVVLGCVLPMLGCLYGALNGKKEMSAVFGAGVDSLGVTLRLAGAAALLAVFAGVVRLLLWPETRARSLTAAGLFLLAIPGSFLAAALLETQIRTSPSISSISASLAESYPAIILSVGYFVRFIYLPLRLVEEGIMSIDPALMEAATLAGHSRLSRAASIALPLAAPHVLAAAALVFILSLGEIPIAARLSPPGIQPATLWLFNQQHMGYDEAVFGLSLLLGGVAALTLFCLGLVTLFLTGRFRKSPI